MFASLKSWTTARSVLASIRKTMVSDMLSFCRLCSVSFCTCESIRAPLESPFHRHALFERNGAHDANRITESNVYQCQSKPQCFELLKKEKGILEGRTPRESGSPDASTSVVTMFNQFNFKLRVRRGCRRHRRRHLRCRRVHHCHDRIDR